jgi:hypothetical protein
LSTQKRWLLNARLFEVLALAAAAYAAYCIISATGDRRWPTVTGRALSSQFAGIVSPIPPSRSGVGRGTAIVQRWSVSYEYEVAGQKHRGESTIGYSPSATLKVYYNPSNPQVSVLEPGVDLQLVTYCLLFSGVFFFVSRISRGAASAG